MTMPSSSLRPGSRVVTRRGTRGTVETLDSDGNVHVRFGPRGSRIYAMRASQLVTESAYEHMQAGGRVLASNQRYNQRSY